MTEALTAAADVPMYVEGGDGPLLAILTPAENPVADVVMCAGGWHGGSVNANRMVVQFARRVAAAGRTVVRFDWHGAGESPGHIRFFRLDDPGSGDVLGAAKLLPDAGLPTALVGICIGTRAALAAAPSLPTLDRIALVSFPLPAARAKTKRAERIGAATALREGIRPSAIRGWFQPATRRVYVKFLRLKWQALTRRLKPTGAAAPNEEARRRATASAHDLETLVAQIAELVDRGIDVLFLFGDQDASYEQFLAAQDGPLGELLERGAANITVEVVPGDLTGYSSLVSQTAFIERVTGWLERPVSA